MIWHPYYSHNKEASTPEPYEMVWVVEGDGSAPGIAYFDGFTWRMLPTNSDDCDVIRWAPLERPGAAETEDPEKEYVYRIGHSAYRRANTLMSRRRMLSNRHVVTATSGARIERAVIGEWEDVTDQELSAMRKRRP